MKDIELENLIGVNKIKYDELMSKHTTMKIGGPCDILVMPESIDDIQKTIQYAIKNNIQWLVLGNGSNTLVSDEGIRGIVIRIGNNFSKIKVDDDKIFAQSGASIPLVSQIAKKNALSGLEFACGIPGTVGGCTRMDAGAYGGQMADVVESVKCLDTNKMEIVEFKNSELDFGYRHSIFSDKKNYIILEVTYKLLHGDAEKIKQKMDENNLARHTKQPLEYPSVGSIFKRPQGYFVGKLVSDSGLRGVSVGGAQVSEKHTGFIINKSNATFKDVMDLIKLVQDTVYKKFGVKLEVEPEIIGGKNV